MYWINDSELTDMYHLSRLYVRSWLQKTCENFSHCCFSTDTFRYCLLVLGWWTVNLLLAVPGGGAGFPHGCRQHDTVVTGGDLPMWQWCTWKIMSSFSQLLRYCTMIKVIFHTCDSHNLNFYGIIPQELFFFCACNLKPHLISRGCVNYIPVKIIPMKVFFFWNYLQYVMSPCYSLSEGCWKTSVMGSVTVFVVRCTVCLKESLV